MKQELNNSDWHEVFAFVGEDGGHKTGSARPTATLGAAPNREYTRDDVAAILFMRDGVNDESPWFGLFHMKDKRYLAVSAGCDYTGWDCQSHGSGTYSDSLEDLLRFGCSEEERELLVALKAPTALIRAYRAVTST